MTGLRIRLRRGSEALGSAAALTRPRALAGNSALIWIAAGLIVVVVATYFVRQEVRKSYPPEIADTISDPKLALEETKKALMMISRGFGKAKEGASKVNMINEAEDKIAGKDKEKKKEKIII